jgi:hypothetical protein
MMIYAQAASNAGKPNPDQESARESVADLPSQAGSLDALFVRLNLAIPSFAGMYWDERGTPRVMLQDVADAEKARSSILKFLRENYPEFAKSDRGPEMKFEKARTEFTWLQIARFKEALRDVLTIKETVSLDADEVCGCVSVGISNERARAAVENFTKLTGVPMAAVRIVRTEPMIPLQSVDGDFRPMVGGIQIKNDASPFIFIGFSTICTLGIVADRIGITGFVTASHCTRVQGGTEGTNFYQNGRKIFGLDYVGHESADPVWTTMPGCPTGMLCRRSDSAFAVIDIGNQNGALTLIAKPSALCLTTATCSGAMPSVTSSLTVTGTAGPPMFGTAVTKVGRTTGWTGGTITGTCVDTPQAATTFTVLCSSLASAGGLGGDSGAPVFSIPAGAGATATTATLVGILWGGNTAGTSIVFSPIGAVLSELAPLQLFPTPPSTTTPTPPSACVVACQRARDACMRAVSQQAGPTPRECVADYRECLGGC